MEKSKRSREQLLQEREHERFDLSDDMVFLKPSDVLKHQLVRGSSGAASGVSFSLIECRLKELPIGIRMLESLEELDVGRYMQKNGLVYIGETPNEIFRLPHWITELQSLRTLILRGNPLSKFLMQSSCCLGELVGLTALGVGCTGLRDVPPWLSKLASLQTLDLSGNIFTGAAGSVDSLQCTALERLYVQHMGFKLLPVWVTNLPSLLTLDVGYNSDFGNSDQCDEQLMMMTGLTSLHLDSIGIYCLTTKVNEKLGSLKELSFTGNFPNLASVLMSHLEPLSSLTYLCLSDAGLKDMHSSVGMLGHLEVLDLGFNQSLSEALIQASFLGNLTQLKTLDLIDTGLHELPNWVSNLMSLDLLDVSLNPDLGARLDECAFFSSLSLLTELFIKNIGLVRVPPWVLQLKQLQTLDVRENRLTDLPLELRFCTNITDLLLVPQQEDQYLPSFWSLDTELVFQYLHDLSRGDVECQMAKLVLVGHPMAGKSSMLDSLAKGSATLRRKSDRTVSIDVRKIKFRNENSRLVLNGYDSGGHSVNLVTHNLFMSDDALFVCVLNVSSGNEQGALDQLLGWLGVIQAQTPGAPVVIVGTHADLLQGYSHMEQNAKNHPHRLKAVHHVMEDVQRAARRWVMDRYEELRTELREAEEKIFDERSVENDGASEELAKLIVKRDEMLDDLMHDCHSQDSVLHLESFGCGSDTAEHYIEMIKENAETAVGRSASSQVDKIHKQIEGLEPCRPTDTVRLRRLRKLVVRQPRIVLVAGVSCTDEFDLSRDYHAKCGFGMYEFRLALQAICSEHAVLPLVGEKRPLNHLMLEHFFRGEQPHVPSSSVTEHPADQSDDGSPQGGPEPDILQEAFWDDVVSRHAAERGSQMLRKVCSEPCARVSDIVREAEECGMKEDEVLRALQFLHAAGSVIFYGNQAIETDLRGWVFTRPQWIIDAIKYVIHEPAMEDVNAELRELRSKLAAEKPQFSECLEALERRGRLCERFLRSWLWSWTEEVRRKFPSSLHSALIALMVRFRLMRKCNEDGVGSRWCQVCCDKTHWSYVVPGMFGTFLSPDWTGPASVWCPEQCSACLAIVRQSFSAGRLDEGFVTALQVEIAAEQDFADFVLAEAKNGSVLRCSRRGVEETVVLSLERGSSMQIHLVGWVRLQRKESGRIEWDLFRHIARKIIEQEQRAAGLNLKKFVPCVNEEGHLLNFLPLGKVQHALERDFDLDIGGDLCVPAVELLPEPRDLQASDSSPCKPRKLQQSLAEGPIDLEAGTIVVRNPDNWRWGDQDGEAGSRGVVIANVQSSYGWVRVHWLDNDEENNYRWNGGDSKVRDLDIIMRPDPGESLWRREFPGLHGDEDHDEEHVIAITTSFPFWSCDGCGKPVMNECYSDDNVDESEYSSPSSRLRQLFEDAEREEYGFLSSDEDEDEDDEDEDEDDEDEDEEDDYSDDEDSMDEEKVENLAFETWDHFASIQKNKTKDGDTRVESREAEEAQHDEVQSKNKVKRTEEMREMETNKEIAEVREESDEETEEMREMETNKETEEVKEESDEEKEEMTEVQDAKGLRRIQDRVVGHLPRPSNGPLRFHCTSGCDFDLCEECFRTTQPWIGRQAEVRVDRVYSISDGDSYDICSKAKTSVRTDTVSRRPEEKPEAQGYTVLRSIGSGAQGTMWLAKDENRGREVALKVFFSDGDEILREAENLKSVRHPNLVGFVAGLVNVSGERRGIVMEYVRGETLESFIHCNKEDMQLDKVCQIMDGLLNGLGAMHDSVPPMIHRDVKPCNIMLQAAGFPVLVDFGVSKRRHCGQSISGNEGFLRGTLSYAAPEMVTGSPNVDVRVDVWACGVVMYEMLMGRRPFDAQNDLALIEAIKMDTYAPIRPLYGCAMSQFIQRALQKQSSSRFRDASSMRKVLLDVIEEPQIVPESLQPSGEFRRMVFFVCRAQTEIKTEEEMSFAEKLFSDKPGYKIRNYSRAQIDDFTAELLRIEKDTEGVVWNFHFAGHADPDSVALCWYQDAGLMQMRLLEEGVPAPSTTNKISGQAMAGLIKDHIKTEQKLQQIHCIFLNACHSLCVGLELWKLRIPHVVCWTSEVKGSTSSQFSSIFYRILSEKPDDYVSAFQTSCLEMEELLRQTREECSPCLLQGSQPKGSDGVRMWSDGKLVPVPVELRGELLGHQRSVNDDPRVTGSLDGESLTAAASEEDPNCLKEVDEGDSDAHRWKVKEKRYVSGTKRTGGMIVAAVSFSAVICVALMLKLKTTNK